MRLAVISNRTFETAKDGWFQIAPIGEFKHPSGIIQVID
jgi:phage I-like protein